MAVEVRTKRGRRVILLSPKEKGAKAASELRDGIHKTNLLLPKLTKTGNKIDLTPEEASYRLGYLAARKDIGKAFNSKRK